MDSLKLELLKNKQEHAQSAIASQEVREHLAGFIRSKRLGSSSQLEFNQQSSPTTSSSSHSTAAGRPNKIVEGTFDALSHDSTPNHNLSSNKSSGAHRQDDHPLRKTASMPTMHIPYKAQSLSRRRQMERRTTMSPLMKRNSRPRRQLVDSSSTEYSSNPCILLSGRPSARSLSQSSSPPPENCYLIQTGTPSTSSKASCSSLTGSIQLQKASQAASCVPSGYVESRLTQSQHPPNQSNQSQTIELSSIFTNRELENIQNNLENSLYFSNQPSTSMSNLNRSTTSITGEIATVGSPSSSPSSEKTALTAKQQQHMKVNEAIRKTVIQRASNKGRTMAISGSLDIESSPRLSRGKDSSNRPGTLNSARGEELRQWSLDAADLRHSQSLAKLHSSFANQMSSGMLFHRDINKLRLATTNDAAALRRSQSPSSSISMGISTSSQQPPASLINGSQINRDFGRQQPLGHSHFKHHSSSSSSTSSLLSQQDSLEDSSQAIDLSSSSDVSRQRREAGTRRSQKLANQLLRSGRANSTINRNYQLLQDSFNQLQLCQQTQQQQTDEMKRILMGNPSAAVGQLYQQPPVSSNQTIHPALDRHAPPLSETTKTTVSLDRTPNFQPDKMIISQHYSSCTSAQSLISSSQEQNDVNSVLSNLRNQFQQQPNDMNQWLAMAYMIKQANDVPVQFQSQSSQLNSSIFAEVASLSEPYKSRILAHLIRQNQQQMSMLQSLANDSNELDTSWDEASRQQSSNDDQRALIGRALSSPLITSAQRESVIQALAQTSGEQVAPGQPISTGVQQQIGALYGGALTTSTAAEAGLQQMIDSSHIKVAGSNLSLDLSVSSRSSGEKPDPTRSSGCNQPVRETPLTFTYTPVDPRQASCNFIYNPTFDSNSTTGLVYELEMCNHKCICANDNNHPENSMRILAIWRRLYERGLMAKCCRIEGRRATMEELKLCHSETYSFYFGKSPYERIKISQLDLSKLPIEGLTQLECGGQGADIDTAWNEELTPRAARLATGCVIEAASCVAKGRLQNAFAIVRPPGHHAEFQQALGFCFFNSVAIAAKVLVTKYQLLRILIVDWDVHHGNGIQRMFYQDKSVMYLSLHRHDAGNFFPGTGDCREVGSGQGEGYNWNIAWSSTSAMGDAEYLAAFRSIVMPIAHSFNPCLVLVACGFDAARGHPFNFGGYELTPACFGYMTRQLLSLAAGKLVLCLEGGYLLNAICDCAESCTRALLNEPLSNPMDQISEVELRREPNKSAVEVLLEVSKIAAKYWPAVDKWRGSIELSAVAAANLGSGKPTASSTRT